LLRRKARSFQTLVVCVALTYVAITSITPLLHSDDCPEVPRPDGQPRSSPSESPCPACKFLAGANATQVIYDSSVVVTPYTFVAAPAPDATVVVSTQCTGSIVLRGPPLLATS
jgi:hypothetical protein